MRPRWTRQIGVVPMLNQSKTLDPNMGQKNFNDISKSTIGSTGGTAHELKDFRIIDRLLNLKNPLAVSFIVLFVYLLVLNREGVFVPGNNETLYLLQPAKLWNSQFLSTDWTFSGPLTTHFIFDFLVGPLTLVFPLEVVGWLGRILCWSLTTVAIFKFGQHFRIPQWMITVSVLLWLFYGQSIVGGEWILGSFESKCIAYSLVFFALNGFMKRREVWPSVLLGTAFSFHPVVGLWSIAAVGLSLILLKSPLRSIVKFGCYTGLSALPGLIPLLMTFEGVPQATDAWEFIARVVIPYHFDPFYFASNKLLLVQLVVLLSFNVIHFALSSKSYALRFLIGVQVFLACFFVLGFLARWAEYYDFLKFMPSRLFPVLVPLFFFFHLMNAVHHSQVIKYRAALVLLGCVAFASFGNPFEILVRHARYHYSMWTRSVDDVEKAFRWIAANTPDDAVVISPPWRGDSFYYSRRAQIASWWVPRFDRLTEWRERLELIAGDVSSVKPETTKARMEHMIDHYNQLGEADVGSLVIKYGAAYLVSLAEYDYPVLFRSGVYSVYSLTQRVTEKGPKIVGE
jgi:hypothetical protein